MIYIGIVVGIAVAFMALWFGARCIWRFAALRKAIGLTLIVLGIILCCTGIGVLLGVPMLIGGAILMFVSNQFVSAYEKVRDEQYK